MAATNGGTLELLLSYGCPRRGLPAHASFARWARAALDAAGCNGRYQLSLRVVDAEEGRMLNRDYRGKDYATNVLSFPAGMEMGRDALQLLGDIALCAPVVEREALEQGKTVRNHCAHLCIHGVLHLLGYDHEAADAAAAMETIEILSLTKLNLPNPYEPDDPGV